MKVKCIHDISNPSIKVGETYSAEHTMFGMLVKYPGGSHAMPKELFNKSFTKIDK